MFSLLYLEKTQILNTNARPKGLVTNYGEGGRLQNGRGWGASEVFYPYKKGGGQKMLSHAEGGHKKSR